MNKYIGFRKPQTVLASVKVGAESVVVKEKVGESTIESYGGMIAVVGLALLIPGLLLVFGTSG